jgi:hypothetical protein
MAESKMKQQKIKFFIKIFTKLLIKKIKFNSDVGIAKGERTDVIWLQCRETAKM